MIRRLLVASLGIVLVVGLVGMGMGQVQKARSKKAQARDGQSAPGSADAAKPADSADSPGTSASKDKSKKVAKLEKATFGGGCFWCTEAVFERIPGVKSV